MTVTYKELLDITKTNPRQLNWWCRDGMIPGVPANPGKGKRRVWTRETIRHVRALRIVADAEITGSTLRHIADVLTDADWTQPLELALADHLVMTVDLPAIDAMVPQFEDAR